MNQNFSLGINGTGCFVEDQHRGVESESTCRLINCSAHRSRPHAHTFGEILVAQFVDKAIGIHLPRSYAVFVADISVAEPDVTGNII